MSAKIFAIFALFAIIAIAVVAGAEEKKEETLQGAEGRYYGHGYGHGYGKISRLSSSVFCRCLIINL